LTSIHTPVVL